MFKHEHDDKGNHRIVQVDDKGKVLNTGEWARYQNFASLNAGGKSTIAVSEFFDGGSLEPRRVYFVERAITIEVV